MLRWLTLVWITFISNIHGIFHIQVTLIKKMLNGQYFSLRNCDLKSFTITLNANNNEKLNYHSFVQFNWHLNCIIICTNMCNISWGCPGLCFWWDTTWLLVNFNCGPALCDGHYQYELGKLDHLFGFLVSSTP